MDDKFTLTAEQENILFNKNLAGIVYSAGQFEGLKTSRLETEEILNNYAVTGATPGEIEVILDLKHALDFVRGTALVDLSTIAHVNALVQGGGGEAPGQLRTMQVHVALTRDDYLPPLPDATRVKAQLTALLTQASCATAAAIDLLLYLSKAQLFTDGNKRTALVVANQVLYHAKAGVMAIPDSKMHWYLSQLQHYYLTGKPTIKQWVYDNAIFGIG